MACVLYYSWGKDVMLDHMTEEKMKSVHVILHQIVGKFYHSNVLDASSEFKNLWAVRRCTT